MSTLKPAKDVGDAFGDALGQRRHDAVGRLDQRDLDVVFRVDLVEAVGDEAARGAMQLGGKLGAGGARADDRHVQLARAHGPFLREGAHAGIDQAPVEALGLFGRVEHDGVLLDARRLEGVADAADGDDERVVLEGAHRRDLAALLVIGGGEEHEPLFAVDAGHLAVAELEAVPVALRLVGDLVAADVHAAGGDLVQQRLPDVRARALHQRDLGLALLAELVAEPRRELEPAGAAAHDDDVVQVAVVVEGQDLRRRGGGVLVVHRFPLVRSGPPGRL